MSNGEHQNEQKGLIAWFAHNHVAANILMFLFLVGGMISITSMRTETFPSIDPKMITISVPYPGATPYEVADSITNRVEEGLLGIEGVKRVTSSASEGYGVVNVELEDFANADDVYNDVETQVNSLTDFPPEDAEKPTIVKLKPTPLVMTLAIHGDVPEKTLKYWAETIEDELRQLPGVANTSLRGIREYQISVEVSEEALQRYGMSLEDINTAIRRFSSDVPAGTIESRQGDILLRVQEKKYTGTEFEKIILRTLPDGSTLRIRDIGHVIDGFEDVNLESRFNGERAAFIDISRSDSEDTLKVANAAKKYLESVALPTGLQLSLQKDETVSLRDRINLMLRNGILGFMLVFLILLLFLDLKLAFWTSVAIPVSFLGGLMLINFMGFSLNMVSLFALIVVLGIVVDDAIVTGESIFDAQEHAHDKDAAVLRGVKRVIAPVTIGVTTTMAAFAPLIFSTGILGQIIQVIPVVVISILFISLIEAYFILPAHLSDPKRWSKGIIQAIRNKFAAFLEKFIANILTPVARFTIHWRYATLAAFVALAIVTAGMFSSGTIRFIFFPQIEADEVSISVEMPQGTPYSITRDTMNNIESAVDEVKNKISTAENTAFQSVSVSIGEKASNAGGPPGTSGSSSGGNHLGEIKIQLVPSDLRSVSSGEIESMIREKIVDLPNIETLEFRSSLVGEEADIEIELSHPEENILIQAAEDLKETIVNIEGTKEVQDSFEKGKTEFVFELTDEGLATGLSPDEIGRQLRGAFFGLEAQRFQRGRSEVIVYVRYPKDAREDLQTLYNARIRLPDGSETPLANIAKIREQNGYSKIETVNGKRIMSVSGDVDYKVTTPNDVIRTLTESDLPQLAARYPGLSYSFEGESREQAEDLASLGRNMLTALMLIYVLLGSILRSYIQPIIIMSAIPFGVVGAIWGHFLLGHDVTFISLFGIVALTGVVVNDSVVLMDFYNQKKKEGLSTFDGLIASIQRRFRPIFLTSMTTSLGLLPMLLETSMQARFLIPMVISLATGIIFATFVILLLVPNLVMIVDDIQRLGRTAKNKIFTSSRVT